MNSIQIGSIGDEGVRWDVVQTTWPDAVEYRLFSNSHCRNGNFELEIDFNDYAANEVQAFADAIAQVAACMRMNDTED